MIAGFAIRSTVELKRSEPRHLGCPKGLTAKAKSGDNVFCDNVQDMLTIVPSLIEGVTTIRKEYTSGETPAWKRCGSKEYEIV